MGCASSVALHSITNPIKQTSLENSIFILHFYFNQLIALESEIKLLSGFSASYYKSGLIYALLPQGYFLIILYIDLNRKQT